MSEGLSVRDLTVNYHTDAGPVAAVDRVSFDVPSRTRLGIVGESGSGKTTVALSLIRLLRPPGRIDGGRAEVDGLDLLSLGADRMRAHRLRTISYIPQGAMNSLNPVLTIGHQMTNVLVDHGEKCANGDFAPAIETALAGVDLPARVAKLYPHELSGGMKQRVCIAMSTMLRPRVIIADEPTSALDVVTQRHVMQTLGAQQQESGSALILIGHDMGLMAQFVDSLAVMYAGRLVEIGAIRDVLTRPRHPYTQALVSSVPRLAHRGELGGIPGVTPSLRELPAGCAFHPRCERAADKCRAARPAIDRDIGAHRAACFFADGAA